MSGVLDDGGSFAFEGCEVAAWDKKKLARHMAVLPQNPDIMFDFTVHDYVMLGRMPHKGTVTIRNGAIVDVDLRSVARSFP